MEWIDHSHIKNNLSRLVKSPLFVQDPSRIATFSYNLIQYNMKLVKFPLVRPIFTASVPLWEPSGTHRPGADQQRKSSLV